MNEVTIQNIATELHESIAKNGLKLRSYAQGVETDRDKQITEAAIQAFEDKLLKAITK